MRTPETIVNRMVVIDAPMEAVWHRLVTPGLASLHLVREEGLHHLKEGSSLRWFDPDSQDEKLISKVRVTVVAPPRHIALMMYDPKSELSDAPENYTSVDITLSLEEDGRTLVSVEQGDFAKHPHAVRLAREAGNRWVEALIRLLEHVEHEAAA